MISTAGGRAGNLPAEVSSFVGRHAELAELARLLRSARLVTVTGVGGVGKTRTALRVAARIRSDFPDGTWLVELSGLQDGALLADTIADALGLRDQSARPSREVLAGYLAGRRLLLVLDTCEHLLEACASLVDALLDAAPDLQIVATSRRPLNVPGEDVFTVPPLPVPDPPNPSLPPDSREPPAESPDSVVLFVERAQAVDPAFAPTAADRALIARLCLRLDGLPLAIELAAARLPALPLAKIIERLDDRFRLLTGGDRTAPARHETLRTTIGWSHELCTPAERLLWARLSVFADGFDLDAAEAVCTDERITAGMLPELLASLTEMSVLTHEPAGPAGTSHAAGGDRFRLLDTLREYGRRWLEALGGHEATLPRRHRDHYLRLARSCAAQWCGPDQVSWYERMKRDHANLRAALEFSLSDQAEYRAGLDLAGTLWLFWLPSGFIREGRHYLERALALDPEPSPARTRALWVSARLAAAQGDAAAAEERIAECRPQASRQGDGVAAGCLDHATAAVAIVRGDAAHAVTMAQRSAWRHREVDDVLGLLFALLMQGIALSLDGQGERAAAVLEECRVECERRGERWVRSFADYARGLAEMRRGDVAAATRFGRTSLRFRRLMHDTLGIAATLDLLASAAGAGGEADRAARLLGAAHRAWYSFGVPQLGSPALAAARERCERQAREALGERAYQDSFDHGAGLGLDAAISYALGD